MSAVHLKNLSQQPTHVLRQLDWNWMLGTDTVPYLTEEVVQVTKQEAEDFAKAAQTLYAMYVEAGQYCIDNELYSALGIPDTLRELIRLSWNDDRHIHLYGRFDLAGGLGSPIKLLEFNADTATCIPETALVQWAQLKANGLDEQWQFNSLFESLVEQFVYLKTTNPDLTPSIVFSTLRGYPEDETNVAVLQEAAREAGFDVAFAYVDELDFSETEGMFIQEPIHGHFVRFDFWFKLIPWESLAEEEPELLRILTTLARSRKLHILNPAYTLLFQSKYILKVLWDLYPYHPLLLQTESYRFVHKKVVSKVLFGREGANVALIEKGGDVSLETSGDYASQKRIYQEYYDLAQDAQGLRYQAGVFMAGEPCGLGFRRGGLILDNTAQFVGHLIV
jgi:glutathionylspermidine synthase